MHGGFSAAAATTHTPAWLNELKLTCTSSAGASPPSRRATRRTKRSKSSRAARGAADQTPNTSVASCEVPSALTCCHTAVGAQTRHQAPSTNTLWRQQSGRNVGLFVLLQDPRACLVCLASPLLLQQRLRALDEERSHIMLIVSTAKSTQHRRQPGNLQLKHTSSTSRAGQAHGHALQQGCRRAAHLQARLRFHGAHPYRALCYLSYLHSPQGPATESQCMHYRDCVTSSRHSSGL